MHPEDERVFVVPEETEMTEDSMRDYIEGVRNGSIKGKPKVRTANSSLEAFNLPSRGAIDGVIAHGRWLVRRGAGKQRWACQGRGGNHFR